jgi:hypothetical protein
MECVHCRTENSEKAKFCHGCGRSLQQEVVCSQCGNKNIPGARFCEECGRPLISEMPTQSTQAPYIPEKRVAPEPASFAGGRYQVRKLLGEGGKKKVYLARDTVLDRDIAFARIKTEKLDEEARTRIRREAQAMGRLGDHPNIVAVYDFGKHEGEPYMVLPLLAGGDVEDLIGYCQVNGSMAIISPRSKQICHPSLHTSRLSPSGKSLPSEESIMNCFEMVATNSEQVLNYTMY